MKDIHNAVEDFISYKVLRRGSTHTTEITYRSLLHDFANRVNCSINELTFERVDQVIDDYSRMGFRPKTLKNKIVVIRSFMKYLYARDRIDFRPERIDIPRIPDDEPNFLTPEEATKLIQACVSARNRAIILTLVRSGLRVSELSDLLYDDLHERSVVVRKGKGGKARVTFIDEETEAAINHYLTTKRRTQYLFTNEQGGKLSRQYIFRIVKMKADKAHIEKKVTPHTLRHTFATMLLRNGARIEDVQPMMGHANISTTRIYMHFTNDYLHQRYDQFIKK